MMVAPTIFGKFHIPPEIREFPLKLLVGMGVSLSHSFPQPNSLLDCHDTNERILLSNHIIM